MMNIQDSDIASYVSIVRHESLWGRKQTLENYLHYIQQESDELSLAIQLDDRINICEEFADTYMMLVFYQQELHEHGAELLASDLNLENKLLAIEQKAHDYDITTKKLQTLVCQKLEFRYPHLLPYQQLMFCQDCFDEESAWKRHKKQQKVLEFCTCTNIKCANYHKVYDGSALTLRMVKRKNTYGVYCSVCKRTIPLSDATIFYGIKKDYNIALRASAEYLCFQDRKNVCQKYKISPKVLSGLLERCIKNYELFEKFVNTRFTGITLPSENDLEYIVF